MKLKKRNVSLIRSLLLFKVLLYCGVLPGSRHEPLLNSRVLHVTNIFESELSIESLIHFRVTTLKIERLFVSVVLSGLFHEEAPSTTTDRAYDVEIRMILSPGTSTFDLITHCHQSQHRRQICDDQPNKE